MSETNEDLVLIISKQTIKPSQNQNNPTEPIHLSPFDLYFITWSYIQKGLLFPKPTHQPIHVTISSLLSSFSATLDRFSPLAGRLCATNLTDSSLSVSLHCTNDGAEFLHATAPSVSVSYLLSSSKIPHIVQSFFPLNGSVNHEGLHKPLLAAQVTELSDGIFLAVSLNHSVADGTSLWQFINSWSATSRGTSIDFSPVFDCWVPDSIAPPPYPIPFNRIDDLIKMNKTTRLPPLEECFLSFSRDSVASIKSRANAEAGTTKISSLQSVLALVWRSVTRARKLNPEQVSTYIIAAGYRTRLGMPVSYFGNAAVGIRVTAAAGEVTGEGLGQLALRINNVVAGMSKETGLQWLENMIEKPSFALLHNFGTGYLLTGSSPRFDVFGNDFGWGKPIAVRSGPAAKVDGKVTVYPGPEVGSMGLEVCLSSVALRALLGDEELMGTVAA